MRKVGLLIILGFIGIFVANGSIDDIDIRRDKVDMNPDLYAYYKKCTNAIHDHGVLSMIDTLFDKSSELGDKRTQAAALCLKVMHYYYTMENHDSLMMHVVRAKKFAKKTHQMRFYYWIWMKLADDYTNHYTYNTALAELQDMRREASQNNDYDGIFNAYTAMSRIYATKRNYELGEKMMRKAVELMDNGKVYDFNRCVAYLRLAQQLVRLGRLDEAKQWIDKSRSCIRTPLHRVNYYNIMGEYGNAKGDKEILKKAINGLKNTEDSNRDRVLNKCYYNLFLLEGNLNAALEMNEKMLGKTVSRHKEYLLRRAEVLSKMPGREHEALDVYKEYISFSDSIYRLESKGSFEEYVAMLDLTRSRIEKKDVEMKLTNEKYRAMMFCLLGGAVLIVLMFVVMFRTKVRLKTDNKAENKVDNKKKQA